MLARCMQKPMRAPAGLRYPEKMNIKTTIMFSVYNMQLIQGGSSIINETVRQAVIFIFQGRN